MKFKKTLRFLTTGLLATSAVLSTSAAFACGGFFCSQNQPVNQAAERIVFAQNDDGTVTAVIQILYQGDAPKFSWLLPISTVPKGDQLALASNIGFTRLQQATNPQYTLQTVMEGTCKQILFPTAGNGAGGSASAAGGATSIDNHGPVTVEASGTLGAFDWTVISVDPKYPDVSGAATTWLTDNGYTVGDGAPGLIRPYLSEGMYLLALRLTKNAGVGSIRPIVLTYDAERPMIPIKLTAVAANDNMGVMTWLLGSARGVPQNYLSLELNDARINWFNANSNYNSVVTAAADEASGQGFVTEFAAPSTKVAKTIWSDFDETSWTSYTQRTGAPYSEAFNTAYSYWGSWDGFWDAMKPLIQLPQGVSFDTYKSCPYCNNVQADYAPGMSFADMSAALEKLVITPVRDMQALFDAHPYTTRLYTTMSARDMTADPLFTFNPDLPEVNNLHTAQRIVECTPDLTINEAPWRVPLPQGTVRGVGNVWPTAFDSQPANTRILRVSGSGSGVVLEDNSKDIAGQIAIYNASLAMKPNTSGSGGAASGGAATNGSGGVVSGTGGAKASGAGGAKASGTGGALVNDNPHSSGGGCSMSRTASGSSASLLGLATLATWLRRRRAATGKASRERS